MRDVMSEPSGVTISLLPNTGIISCMVFKPELSALGIEESRVVYLEQKYHRDPEILLEKVKASLAVLEQNNDLEAVILLYGYCGGGLANLSSDRVSLIIPLAHDCIPLFLGVRPPDDDSGSGNAFYLNPGWIDHGLTPYTEYFKAVEIYGQEDALWLGMEMLKNYREVILVETIAGVKPHHRRYARNMADLFNLAFREIKTDTSWIADLLSGKICKHTRVIRPGTPICIGLYPSTGHMALRSVKEASYEY